MTTSPSGSWLSRLTGYTLILAAFAGLALSIWGLVTIWRIKGPFTVQAQADRAQPRADRAVPAHRVARQAVTVGVAREVAEDDLRQLLERTNQLMLDGKLPSDGEPAVVFVLGIVVLGALVLYAWRAPTLDADVGFKPLSRETFLLLNNVLLVVATAVVLFGTLSPLIVEMATGGKISMGPPWFNFAFLIPTIPRSGTMGCRLPRSSAPRKFLIHLRRSSGKFDRRRSRTRMARSLILSALPRI